MNVLLTGGAGYIGSHVSVALASKGHKIVIYDNLSNSTEKAVDGICNIMNLAIPLVVGDVLDEELLCETLKKYEIQAIMHFAGLKSVSESHSDPLAYYKNNCIGTHHVCSAMRRAGVLKLVFSSSATVYGPAINLPIDEDHSCNPQSPYGRTKHYAENFLNDLAVSDSRLSIVALRYFNPVGAHSSYQIGESPLGPPNNLMPNLVRVAAGEIPFLYVFGNNYGTPDGTALRDYIHVEDLADGHSKALDHALKTTGFQVFNLGTGNPYSVLQIIDEFEAVNQQRVKRIFTGRRAGDIDVYYANPSRAHNVLGWQAQRGLREMCQSAWQYFVAGGLRIQ